ncbi:unnamed protein product [Clonostachys rosea]|uniref:Cytochrome P450 n=1 Tax=Bionectria ochroleuca TaxID=29856 RepID=A0ABY6UML2_BIOOC|nr:unnamed protein product [Clonostachys rosea]
MMRKAQKTCTLADGTSLPQGRWVVVPAYSINRSSQWHDEPETFDAFRFSRLAERDGFGNRHGIVIPGRGFLTFGIGKHACPGRYFAAVEMKLLLAYLICNYDFKFAGNGRRSDKFFLFSCSPDYGAPLIVKRRMDSSKAFLGTSEGSNA